MPTRWCIIVALAILVGATAGCSEDEPTGPTPEQITGDWIATKVEYVSVPPGTTVELIALGGTSTLALSGNGSFHFVVTPHEEASNITDGVWALSDDMMNLTPQGMPFSWEFEVSFSAGNLGLSGGSVEYDFNDDDAPDQAKLNLRFVR